MNLTEVKFWEKYWDGIQLPSEVDMNFSFDRCLANALKKQLTGVAGDVFEIGCAPGKWLAFLSSECKLRPNGIEYSTAGMNAVIDNFNLLNISSGIITEGDFFTQKITRQFDVVMSLGFIEHFDNVHDVVDLHLQWLKPGGKLVLGVPNFSGVTKIIQSVVDKTLLEKHNLNIMNLDYFDDLGRKFYLNKVFIDYIGSFEPALPIPKYKRYNILHFLCKCFLYFFTFLRRYKIFDQLNSRYFSSYILAVYEKRR